MKIRIYAVAAAMVTVMTIGGISYAGGPAGGSMGGMGGQGHGVMGEHGSGMMGYGSWFENLWKSFSKKTDKLNREEPRETKQLREKIREKRQELSDLYRSDNPDKDLIDQKIGELSRLEAELDRKLSEY